MVGTPEAGAGVEAPADVVPGPPLHRLVLVIPTQETAWRVAWAEGARTGSSSAASGAASGFLTGLGIVFSTPVLVLAWPAALGIVAGATTLGAVGKAGEGPSPWSDSQDRRVVQGVLTETHPERAFRESLAEHLRERRGLPVITIGEGPAGRAEAGVQGLLALARAAGADALVEATVEGFGLAVGEQPDTLGLFVRARLRIRQVSDGRLRYERVLQHGPGKRLEGMPGSAGYTLGFLAVDDGAVLKAELAMVVRLLGKAAAEDPNLPLAPGGR